MANYYRALTEILEAHGCYFVRQGATSHEIWFSPIKNRNFVVVSGCDVRHTANKSLKDAGINRKL